MKNQTSEVFLSLTLKEGMERCWGTELALKVRMAAPDTALMGFAF